jgi:hypothetical protein
MQTLMKCGHSTTAKDKDGKPVCIICFGVNNDATIVEDNKPNLTGRKAICCQHKHLTQKIVDSNFNLPFFEYRPDEKYDAFYCGCWGWD